MTSLEVPTPLRVDPVARDALLAFHETLVQIKNCLADITRRLEALEVVQWDSPVDTVVTSIISQDLSQRVNLEVESEVQLPDVNAQT